MGRNFRATYPGERAIILAEERHEWRAGLGAVVVIGGAAIGSWLVLSAPQSASDLAGSVIPAAEAATLFNEQPSPFDLRNGATPIEVAQADAPLGEGEIITLQNRLKSLGYDPGKADGVAGQRTLQALNAYRQSRGLKAIAVVDREAVAPLTR